MGNEFKSLSLFSWANFTWAMFWFNRNFIPNFESSTFIV
jgi:hypothetical protein